MKRAAEHNAQCFNSKQDILRSLTVTNLFQSTWAVLLQVQEEPRKHFRFSLLYVKYKVIQSAGIIITRGFSKVCTTI